MEHYSWEFLIWATSLGALSAFSLPIGSLVGLRTNPRPQYISILAAFGAGALIAALSVELVAPTVFALHEETGTPTQGEPVTHFFFFNNRGSIRGCPVCHTRSTRQLPWWFPAKKRNQYSLF